MLQIPPCWLGASCWYSRAGGETGSWVLVPAGLGPRPCVRALGREPLGIPRASSLILCESLARGGCPEAALGCCVCTRWGSAATLRLLQHPCTNPCAALPPQRLPICSPEAGSVQTQPRLPGRAGRRTAGAGARWGISEQGLGQLLSAPGQSSPPSKGSPRWRRFPPK